MAGISTFFTSATGLAASLTAPFVAAAGSAFLVSVAAGAGVPAPLIILEMSSPSLRYLLTIRETLTSCEISPKSIRRDCGRYFFRNPYTMFFKFAGVSASPF